MAYLVGRHGSLAGVRAAAPAHSVNVGDGFCLKCRQVAKTAGLAAAMHMNKVSALDVDSNGFINF